MRRKRCSSKNSRTGTAYRRRTARIECRECELRFSVDIVKFAMALLRKPELAIAADPTGWALAAAITGHLEDDDKGRQAMQEIVKEMGVEALESHARALGTWEAFAERLGPSTDDQED
jgi:hypothetical protein